MKKLKLRLSLIALDIRLAYYGFLAMLDSHKRMISERKYKERVGK